MANLEELFKPISLGSLELRNRIVWPAITTYYDTHYDMKGEERSAYFYAKRSKGGAGLLIIGALQAIYPGRREYRVAINNDKYIPQLQRWVKAIHDNGAKVAAQLAVWNYWAKEGEQTPAEDVSPSGVVTINGGFPQEFSHTIFAPKTRSLTVEEIHMIEEQVGDASVRAANAGFDAIELPAVSGNLLNRFITPYTNRRNDDYGGSLENRMRILTEIIANIKRKVGDNFPLICRISGTDMMPWGLTLEDAKEFAPLIETAGVHAISVFAGWYESRQPKYQMCVPRGSFTYLAEGIKQVVSIPVCTNIRVNDTLLAERILVEGKADLIAMGRPLIADPDLPNKAKEGRLEDIRFCVACCECFVDIANEQPLGCSVNAMAGREAVCAITVTDSVKNVFVIGGGPAGMEAARVAALIGHRVTLFEKKDKLGGKLLYAVIPPYKDEWNTLINYLTVQLNKMDVKVRLREEATVSVVEEGKPDAVIIATGARAIIPEIPGVDSKNVATAIDVLSSNKGTGRSVVIIGGGLIGCETAEFLSQKGKEVTIIEMLPLIGADIAGFNRWVILDRLKASGIRMETNMKVEEITESGVNVARDEITQFIQADSVVIATGMRSNDDLAKQLEGKISSLYLAGDCVEPRQVKQAIKEGFDASLQLI